ncbi:MAG TPA: inorganic phosphate transporter, partial [Rhizobiales bacterium]|nr:inorganic phosphate transporter [Hyphomicrobiales bacterium]
MAESDRSAGAQKPQLKKVSLDKDLTKIVHVEAAAYSSARRLFAPGMALLFLAAAGAYSSIFIGAQPNAVFIIVAAMLGGYMALNIGANDVANNVGPAVGSRALSLTGALIIAAIFESAGALIAGGDVVNTISKGIIDPSLVPDTQTFVWIMMAALLSSALWVNLATWLAAPVSTTHAVVGGVMGGGIAAVGFSTVNWVTMGKIAASWVISPILGGVIAALFLAFIKINVIYQDDKIAAARRWVPVLLAIMAAVFSSYLALKGFKRVWRPDAITVLAVGAGIFVVALVLLRPWVRAKSEGMENRNESLRALFHLPLICSAALLSFAHGANDVANAVGPLAAILHSAQSGDIVAKVGIPVWVMLIGAVGISLGLFLYGPRLIRMVGEQITKMNPMRAFCVALSAAITVIFASGLGLPVSSTHIAVGAVFGVGFFREFYTSHSKRRRAYVKSHVRYPSPAASQAPSRD